MQRFSAFASTAIPIMIALGLWLVWRLTGGLSAAFSSLYGQLLLAKFFVASSALGIGAFNKLSVAKTLQASPERGRRVLARTSDSRFPTFRVSIRSCRLGDDHDRSA